MYATRVPSIVLYIRVGGGGGGGQASRYQRNIQVVQKCVQQARSQDFLLGGGGADSWKLPQKKIKFAQSRNIKLYARSAPQKWKLCMFCGIFILNLMVFPGFLVVHDSAFLTYSCITYSPPPSFFGFFFWGATPYMGGGRPPPWLCAWCTELQGIAYNHQSIKDSREAVHQARWDPRNHQPVQ